MALSLPTIKKTVSKTVKSVQNLFFNIDTYAHQCAAISELSYQLEDLTGTYWINNKDLDYELRLTCGEIIFTTSDRAAFITELKNQLKAVNS
tara:strand:- start:172 stop:447 length:276 start_codon:yes stop_codon:yes gene_type:complete